MPRNQAVLTVEKPSPPMRFAAFGAAGALLVFALIAAGVADGRDLGWERALLLSLREAGDAADPLGPAWFEAAVMDLTALGGFAVLTLVTLLAVGYLLAQKQVAAALFVALSVSGGVAISEGAKLVFARERPDFVAHIVETTSMSFPSGHAMLSAVTYLTLGALLSRAQRRRRLRLYVLAAALGLTLLIGMSRVYLGVHWPTDVLAGWCLGAAWALCCWALASWMHISERKEGGAR